jgi:hypothetical protein
LRLLVLGVLLPLACSKSEPPAPAPTATPIAAPKPVASAAAPAAPTAQGSPGAFDMNDFSDVADFEWDLAEEAEDEEFEIDAAITAFYMPQGNIVAMKAKALNGTPPFKFEWDFGDGSPKGTGEMIKHQYTKIGRFMIAVVGTDASGATARMDLGILVDHPVNYAYRLQMDPKVIDEMKARYGEPPAPAPAATP